MACVTNTPRPQPFPFKLDLNLLSITEPAALLSGRGQFSLFFFLENLHQKAAAGQQRVMDLSEGCIFKHQASLC